MLSSISPDLADFLESGISILVGTRDARLTPEVARAVGARIEPGGRELTVYVPDATAARTLANLRDNGRLAVCFAAVDHRSFQFKGRAVEVRPARPDERPALERYRAAVAQHFGSVGLAPRLTQRLTVWPAHALRLCVEAAFEQTPGPGAGAALAAAKPRAKRKQA